MVGDDGAHIPQGQALYLYVAAWDQKTLLDTLLLIFLTIKFAYFPQGAAIKKKPTVV